MNEQQYQNSNEQVRQPEIPHQIECLQRTLEGCMDTAKQLEHRLAPVVRPELPPPPTGPVAPQLVPAGPSTNHGASIADMVRTAANINANLQSVLGRLEV